MILTVTMNPSVDMSYILDPFKVDTVNRVSEVSKTAGGKGLNVTRVLHQLQDDVISTGIIGGFMGAFIEKNLENDHISSSFYHTNKESRNCIAILHEGKQTEILESGPTLSQADEEGFLEHLSILLETVDVLVISGSLPRGLSVSLYAKMIKLASDKKIPVLLDTSGKALETSLENKLAKPFLIKPNQEEISQLLNKPIASNFEELKADLESPLFNGVEWIVVSLGADGAFVKHKDQFFKADIPKITVVNPVGSGDSTVAGLASAIAKGLPTEEVIRYGMTAGLLNAMEQKTGWINPEKFDEYYTQVLIRKLNA